MYKMLGIHRHVGYLVTGFMLSFADDDSSGSLGSESSGSGISDESSGSSDEASSLSCVYSSSESSSPGRGRRAYRRGMRGGYYNDYDYRQIPRRRW